MLVERFLFVFAITIPFDIRDMQADTRQRLKTIPLLIGKKNSMIVANTALILFLAVCVLHYNSFALIWLNCAFSLSAVSTLFFMNNKRLQATQYYHYGILDGTMLLQGLFVLAGFYFHLAFFAECFFSIHAEALKDSHAQPAPTIAPANTSVG